MKLRTSFLIVAVLAVASACGGQAPAGTTGPGVTRAPGATAASQPTQQPAGPTAAPPVGGSGTSVIHVVVASGPQAGTYDKTGIKYDCNISPTGSGATYLELGGTEGVTSMSFLSSEGGPSPTIFYFQVLFGAISGQQASLQVSTLDPTHPDGSGTASLQDNTSTIKWTFDGTTADGIDVNGTIECGPVDRT